MNQRPIVCAYLYVISQYGYPPPAEQTNSYLREMKSLGFSQVELEGIRAQHLMEMHSLRKSIKKELDSLQLDVPVYCTVLPGLSSPDKRKRTSQINLFRYGCETAATLGASYVLDNCPLVPFIFPDDIPIVRHYDEDVLSKAILPKEFNWPSFYAMLVKVFREICHIAAEFDLTYLMHPAVGTLFATPTAFLAFHKDVGCHNLGYNFDTANLIALQQNLSLALHQLRGFMPYIHISDTNLHQHQHLPIGAGCIGWHQFFTHLKDIEYNGLIGIDIGGAESSIAHLDQAYRDALNYLVGSLN